jgi:glycosyltransferase involved in cell wall biosynthesis
MKIAIGGIRGIPARYGGFETSAAETAPRLKQLGHGVSVYCRGKQAAGGNEYDGIKLVYLTTPASGSLETICHSVCLALHVFFANRDVEVVHLYNAASSVGCLLLRLAGIPVVMTIDGVEWNRDKWNWIARLVWRVLTWLATHSANVIVCDSNTVRGYFERKYGKEILYIPYGSKQIQGDSNLYKQFSLEHKGYFLFVGRFVPEKGVDTLIEAHRLSGSSLPLVIIGDNNNDPDYVAALRSTAAGNVHFLGFRYGAEYESVLAHSRAYVSASKLEGTSPSLLAAMGAGVCSLVNGIPENRETGGQSVLYFDGTAADLALKMALLSDSPEEVERYAVAGLDRVREFYDWDAVTKRYLGAYRAAIGTEPAPVSVPTTANSVEDA